MPTAGRQTDGFLRLPAVWAIDRDDLRAYIGDDHDERTERAVAIALAVLYGQAGRMMARRIASRTGWHQATVRARLEPAIAGGLVSKRNKQRHSHPQTQWYQLTGLGKQRTDHAFQARNFGRRFWMLPFERIARLPQPSPQAIWIEACLADAAKRGLDVSNRDVAERVALSTDTVKKHRQRHRARPSLVLVKPEPEEFDVDEWDRRILDG